MQDWLSPKVEVRETNNKGKGMFAKEDIKKGEDVVRWNFKEVGKGEAELGKRAGKQVMQWDENVYSVEDKGVDDGYFINHSCNPNIWMNGAHLLTTRRDIAAGEEITADYALWEADENYVSKWECSCGESNCRKRVTGKDWQNKEIQLQYAHHFSPLINKRIKQYGNI